MDRTNPKRARMAIGMGDRYSSASSLVMPPAESGPELVVANADPPAFSVAITSEVANDAMVSFAGTGSMPAFRAVKLEQFRIKLDYPNILDTRTADSRLDDFRLHSGIDVRYQIQMEVSDQNGNFPLDQYPTVAAFLATNPAGTAGAVFDCTPPPGHYTPNMPHAFEPLQQTVRSYGFASLTTPPTGLQDLAYGAVGEVDFARAGELPSPQLEQILSDRGFAKVHRDMFLSRRIDDATVFSEFTPGVALMPGATALQIYDTNANDGLTAAQVRTGTRRMTRFVTSPAAFVGMANKDAWTLSLNGVGADLMTRDQLEVNQAEAGLRNFWTYVLIEINRNLLEAFGVPWNWASASNLPVTSNGVGSRIGDCSLWDHAAATFDPAIVSTTDANVHKTLAADRFGFIAIDAGVHSNGRPQVAFAVTNPVKAQGRRIRFSSSHPLLGTHIPHMGTEMVRRDLINETAAVFPAQCVAGMIRKWTGLTAPHPDTIPHVTVELNESIRTTRFGVPKEVSQSRPVIDDTRPVLGVVFTDGLYNSTVGFDRTQFRAQQQLQTMTNVNSLTVAVLDHQRRALPATTSWQAVIAFLQ